MTITTAQWPFRVTNAECHAINGRGNDTIKKKNHPFIITKIVTDSSKNWQGILKPWANDCWKNGTVTCFQDSVNYEEENEPLQRKNVHVITLTKEAKGASPTAGQADITGLWAPGTEDVAPPTALPPNSGSPPTPSP